MMRSLRGWPLLVALFAAYLAAGLARAQPLPPQPVPVAPAPTVTPGPPAPPPSTELTPPPLAPPPAPWPPAPAGGCLPLDYHDPLPNHDALLDTPTAPRGWFVGAEVSFLKPHVHSSLTGAVPLGSSGDVTVQLPGADLDWIAAARFELGYRFADGIGAVLVSYRTLGTDGRVDVLNFDGQGDNLLLRSHLDMDVFDFDYATPVFSLGRRLDLRARAGVRLADVFFDTQVVGEFVELRSSNHFIGAGPHAGLDLWYRFDVPGLALFARADGALPIGRVHQDYEAAFAFDDGSTVGGSASQGSTRAVPTVSAQLGIGWQPLGTRLRFTVGYEFEYWWGVGHAGDSRADIFDQGGFFRGEFNF
jgi:hypothetical protein